MKITLTPRLEEFACYSKKCAPPPTGTGGSERGRGVHRISSMRVSARLLTDNLLIRALPIAEGEARTKIKREMSRRGLKYTPPE